MNTTNPDQPESTDIVVKQGPSKPLEENVDTGQRKLQRLTIIVAIVSMAILGWYIAADQYTPFTDNARVRAFVSPIAPSVSGHVVHMHNKNNDIVNQGQIVARINPEPYLIAVDRAEAALEIAGQEVGAKTAHVAAANAQLVEVTSQYNQAKLHQQRVTAIGKKGYVSQAEVDRSNTQVEKYHASIARAEANLEQAKLDAGLHTEHNPRLQKALADLSQARIDLENTVIRAPALGLVSNIRYDMGVYVNAGTPIMTHISAKDIWLEAHLRENNLQNIKLGDPVSIVFDAAPGNVYQGKVSSISFGVHFDSRTQVGDLQAAMAKSGWLREAQRFPVLIELDQAIPPGIKREGGQADIMVFTDSSGILSYLGNAYIQLIKWLSYVY